MGHWLQSLTFHQTTSVCLAKGPPLPLCLLARGQLAASEEALAPQGETDWYETDRSKALANTGLIEGEV